MTDVVKIKAVDLKQFVEDSMLLKALYDGGVTDWGWYDDVLDTYEEEFDEEGWRKYCVE